MLKILKKFINNIKTICKNPLIINAYVKKTPNDDVIHTNWGDDINYYLINYLTKRNISIYFSTPVATLLKMQNYLCIGSTLNYLTTPQSIVWGAGVISDNIEMRAEPARVLAVRGPLTRQYLLSRRISCPEVYGDPALLIPYFYKPKTSNVGPHCPICILPHYADMKSPILEAIRGNHPEVRFIDISNYKHWTDFIDQICECEAVFSSSLHGLIIAEAYGIPNYWISVSDNVIGQGFKFRDYYESIGKSISLPIILDETSDPMALREIHPWNLGRIDLKKLLAACPFKIIEPIRYEHPLDL